MEIAIEALKKLGVSTVALMPEVLVNANPVVVRGGVFVLAAVVGYGIYYFFFKKLNVPQQEPLLGDQ